jgi:hypothetical protein
MNSLECMDIHVHSVNSSSKNSKKVSQESEARATTEARDGGVMLHEARREVELLRVALSARSIDYSEAMSKVRELEESARMMDKLLVQTQDYKSKLERKLDTNRS